MNFAKMMTLEGKLAVVSLLYRALQKDLSGKEYWSACRKIMSTLWKSGIEDIYHQGKASLDVEARLVSDKLTVSADREDPVLIIVVKDDLLRMRLLYEHYCRIGVHQFVVLDNGSTDGTMEFVSGQPDTRIYSISTPYFNIRKEGWVEYAMRRVGLDRWFIVVDSDEMLDYPGSETHSVQELIRAQMKLGNDRLYGFMLDMYPDAPLYSVVCSSSEIPEKYCWFDRDSFYIDDSLYGMKIPMGGARERVTGVRMWAGKCPVFLFKKEMTNISAHFQYPLVPVSETNLCTVVRHYKYLAADKKQYEFRSTQESGYGATAREYAVINEKAGQKNGLNMKYEGSVRYRDSRSLSCLPGMYQTF